MAARRTLVYGAALLLALVLLASSLRARRHRLAPPPSLAWVELSWDVLAGHAPEAAFRRALDRAIVALAHEGQRPARVSPAPRAADLHIPGLDGSRLGRALAGEPLLRHRSGIGDAGDDAVRVWLDGDEVDRLSDAALWATAQALRARVMSARACDACSPALVVSGQRVTIRLPWIDDRTERRVRESVSAAPPLPVPVLWAGSRVVDDKADEPLAP